MTLAEDLAAEFARWDRNTQEAARLAYLERSGIGRQPFYCGIPDCNGKPHGGWTWSHARWDQHPPQTPWDTWIELSGRGSGKTRSGSEWTHQKAKRKVRLALVAPTAADARDVMVEGESGLLATQLPQNPCVYESSKRRVTWPATGAQATLYTAEKPDRLRGPQHHAAWVDEACFMPNVQKVWDNLQFGLRLGLHPQAHITSTPKPREWLKTLLADAAVVVSRASTYANIDNLAPRFRDAVLSRYEGTRLGRQEIHAEVLEDVEGALWTAALIDKARVDLMVREQMDAVVVGLDPSGTSTGDEAGIVVVGRRGPDAYILDDLSGQMTPAEWATAAIKAYSTWDADAVIVETNYGGDMVAQVLRSTPGGSTLPIIPVRAKQGKALRAEPVVGLSEQRRVHIVGVLTDLEAQMTGWVPDSGDDSPDRLDAMVYGVLYLIVRNMAATTSSPVGRRRSA